MQNKNVLKKFCVKNNPPLIGIKITPDQSKSNFAEKVENYRIFESEPKIQNLSFERTFTVSNINKILFGFKIYFFLVFNFADFFYKTFIVFKCPKKIKVLC